MRRDSFIDSEADVDFSSDYNTEKQYYEPHELKSGGSKWLTNLLEKWDKKTPEKSDYQFDSGYDTQDSFIDDGPLKKVDKTKKRKKRHLKKKSTKIDSPMVDHSPIVKSPVRKIRCRRIIVDSDDDMIPAKRKPIFEEDDD